MNKAVWCVAVAMLAMPLLAQPKDYKGKKGNIIHFPLGELSFADEVVSFDIGSPGPKQDATDPSSALGPPDRRPAKRMNKAVTLGCGGVLTLRFVDNSLVDVPGPDLYVFEVGDDTEPTDVAISADGKQWIRIGNIAGGTGEMDIKGKAKLDEAYHFVRLTDLRTACHGSDPGADIDAVGAIGAGVQISLDAAVLFDTGKYVLRDEAKGELDRAADAIREHPGARVVVEGHTDKVGSSASNLKLSNDRAAAVRDYLASVLPKVQFRIAGYGETRPVASNDSEEGRQRNRRVDIVVFP
jgi:outer membrane protein OmpA-like peptidoglycan-associated protein